MKITNVALDVFAWKQLQPVAYMQSARRTTGSAELGLLRIETDEGIVGHAFLGSSTYSALADGPSLIRVLKPLLMGRNPLDREKINSVIWPWFRVTSARTIGAVDVALWDIAGKFANLPIHRLMGTFRESLPAYASSAILPTVEDYVEEALHYQAAGWQAYKIHPPQQWKKDIEICAAVRRAVGDDYVLMLDSTWSYEYPEALRVGRAIEEMGYHWFEDPLHHHDIVGYMKLREKLDIPLVATEQPAGGLESYAAWLKLGATDYLRGDVAVKGGLTTALKTAHLAEAFKMKYEIHHSGNSLNNVANLHLCMAIANTTYFEVLLPDANQKYGLVHDIVVDKDGLVHAPDKPGLGYEIDFELISANLLQTLE